MPACSAAVTVQSASVPEHRSSAIPLAALRDELQIAKYEPGAVLQAQKRAGLLGIEHLVGAVEHEALKARAVRGLAAERTRIRR